MSAMKRGSLPSELVKLICGMIAADESLMRQAESRLEKLYGAIDLRSDIVPFDYTDYYKAEMGGNLLRAFVSFHDLIDPGQLAEIMISTNSLEETFAVESGSGRKRRINIDPGYVTPAKLVLATTKDFSHRIYLCDGIYAEVTLNFKKTGCSYFDWTYPDFKSGKYTPFLAEVRRRVMAAEGCKEECKPQMNADGRR